MKHTHKITLILIAMFLLSQLIGILVINKNISVFKTISPQGKVESNISYYNTPALETVQVEDESMSYIPIFIAIILGTIVGLLLAKFRSFGIWRVWFFLAVIMALYKSFATFVPAIFAGVVALVLAFYKIFRPNIYVHNFTELFIYAGIAAIFVPILNVFSASILLILIAIYDMYAVWKSKHMITLAKFQTQTSFAGLFLQYDSKKGKLVTDSKEIVIDSTKSASTFANKKIPVPKDKKHMSKDFSPIKNAILGGGDMAFPILFAGAVLKSLLLADVAYALLKVLLIPLFSTIAVAGLFYFAKKDTFYPAMPFISAGCFLGYGVILLSRLF